jgi:CheY-like chemotaxis protein
VESEPGRGTTFTVYLPTVEAPADEPAAPDASEEPARGSETILLVEDEGLVRELVREMLEVNGYTVLEASDSQEAVEICRDESVPIHLMLTDVVLPEMSGPELTTRLTPHRPELKVLYMSGYTDDVVLKRGLLSAETWFLQKPFSKDVLAAKTREVLDAA